MDKRLNIIDLLHKILIGKRKKMKKNEIYKPKLKKPINNNLKVYSLVFNDKQDRNHHDKEGEKNNYKAKDK